MEIRKIEFYKHNLDESDIAAVNDVLRSYFLTTGPVVGKFENKFANYLQVREAVGVTSCTAALQLALMRHGIGVGDDVITTPMTFCATATAIIQAGANPVFVDVSPRTGMIEPAAVAFALTPKTKAIIPVHLYGRMADMKGFMKLAEKHDLVLIEDAAHATEAMRDGIRPGQCSHAACFSFYATKGMTSGEGGAIACNSQEDAAWYRSARHHGISKNASLRYTEKYQHWDMEMMGWKYNMDDIQAALLLNQINRLDEYRSKRCKLETQYRELLADVEGLEFIDSTLPYELSGHHLFTTLLPRDVERDSVLHRLQEKGIGCAVNYRAVHNLTFFKKSFGYKPADFPCANEIGERTISLPMYPKLTEEEVEVVSKTLIGTLNDLRTN